MQETGVKYSVVTPKGFVYTLCQPAIADGADFAKPKIQTRSSSGTRRTSDSE